MKSGFKKDILDHSTVHIDKCYQCGKCTAGCPMREDMDYAPNVVIRMLQTGSEEMKEKVLRSFSIWVCLSCETCYSRCPMSIEIPKLMDFLREKSLESKKVHPKAKNIIAFHKSFLKSIEKTGRLYEIGLVAGFKMRTFKIIQDMVLVPKMFFSGKLNLFPELIHDRKGMSALFSATHKKKP